ncbi:hypothetical protein MNBD_GAMMA21-1533 [hydrothermal vent metagenome]|uniref:TonB-dependent receptor n=1 Tax=hydrothermal vent metagenome TaxID=652676 RepID=A0A3B1ABU2_9ZZZZ
MKVSKVTTLCLIMTKTVVLVGVFNGLLIGSSNVFAKDVVINKVDELLDLPFEELFNVEITSTSYFPETPLDVASTVTVILREDWEQRGARRLDDALSNMPGFTPLPHFLGAKQWGIRGLGSGNGSGVQTLWDGVSINTFPTGMAQLSNPNLQLNTLNSIEVIRGPGSALYGTDAFHGVVSMTAYEADENEQQITSRLGSNGYYEGAYNASTDVFNNWRLNLAIASSGQPNQGLEYEYLDSGVVNTAKREYNYNTSTASIKLASDKEKKTAYGIGLYYNNNKQTDFYHDGASVPANDTSDGNSQLAMVKFDVTQKINQHSKLSFDVSYWIESHDFHRILSPANNQINIFVDEENQKEAKVIYQKDNLFVNTELSVGLSYRENNIKNAYRTIVTADGNEVLNAPLTFSDNGRQIKSFLADGKTTLKNGDYVIRYGFRYDDFSDFGSHIAPRLGIIRKLDETSAVKLLYGNAFRAPTANELYGSPFVAGNLNLDPEEIDTYELVYLQSGRDSKLEIVLFYTEWKNAIDMVGTFPNQTTVNITESQSNGVEVSYLKKINNWKLDLSGSYVDSKDKTNNLDYVIYPTYIINLGAAYQFRNALSVQINNRILLDMSKNPNTATVEANELRDYWRVDVNVTKKYNEKWDVFANIRNLLNRNNQLPSTGSGVNQNNFLSGIQDEEISFDLGARYKF